MGRQREGEHRNTVESTDGPVVQARDIHGDVVFQVARRFWAPGPVDTWPLPRDTDPLHLGVHRARPGPDGGELPPYVARDADPELRTAVGAAGHKGGFVLVTGDSTAGKTRAAWEAVRTELPDHRVLTPPRGAELAVLAGHPLVTGSRNGPRWLLWLDDAEGHLGSRALESTLVDALTRAGVAIVATLQTRYYDTYRTARRAPGDHATQHDRLERDTGLRVLALGTRVRVDRRWTAAELRRATGAHDPRLSEAAEHGDRHGVAEYLAAGPDLLGELSDAQRPAAHNGHPRGHALVSAAVDLARTGLNTPVSRRVLDQLHTDYLTDAAPLRPEPLDDAWEWATEIRHGVTSMMLPTDIDATMWRPFDYLVGAMEDSRIPLPTWRTALRCARNDEAGYMIGVAAHHAGVHEIATTAWRPITGDMVMGASFAYRLHGEGDLAGAEHWYRETAASGHKNAMLALAALLKSQGRHDEADEWNHRYRKTH